jgi:hypothetical protein
MDSIDTIGLDADAVLGVLISDDSVEEPETSTPEPEQEVGKPENNGSLPLGKPGSDRPINGSKRAPTTDVIMNKVDALVGVFAGIDGRRAHSTALANCIRLAKAEPRRFGWLVEKATLPMTIVIAHTLFTNPNRPTSIEELKSLIADDARKKPAEIQEEWDAAMRQLVLTVKQRDKPHPMGTNLELLPGARILWRGPYVLNRKIAMRYSV